MKKHSLIFFLILISIQINAQTNRNENPLLSDTRKAEEKGNFKNIENLENSITSLNKEFANFKRINDSLSEQNSFFKLKEDYYTAALSEQSTRFALIITGLLALLAILSFSIFKIELKIIEKKTNKKLAKQTNEFEKASTKINSMNRELLLSQGNLNATIGFHLSSNNELVDSAKYHLLSAKFNLAYQTTCQEDNLENLEDDKVQKTYKVIISHLIYAKKQLKKIEDEKNIKYLKESSKELLEILVQISSCNRDDIKLKVAELRVEIQNR